MEKQLNKTPEIFVPYKIALALSKMDFDERCYAMYQWERGSMNIDTIRFNGEIPSVRVDNACKKQGNDIKNIKCPTHQQVIDWFRKKHKISIEPSHDWASGNDWTCVAMGMDGTFYADTLIYHKDYYIALNRTILKTLKLKSIKHEK